MSYFINLTMPAYSAGEELLDSCFDGVCVCCLARNVPYVNLTTCKHTEFLASFYKFKTEFPSIVCQICHEMLKKIDIFKKQVEDSALVLNKEVLSRKVRNLYNLQVTKNMSIDVLAESTADCKDEPLCTEEDVKEESDASEPEAEMPMPVNDHTEAEDTLKKESSFIRIKREHLDPSPFMEEKHVGKLKMHLLSREELETERALTRTEEKYQKLPYKCETCIIGFNREIYLKKHNKQRHAVKIAKFSCDVCNSVFDTEISLKPHYRRHFIRYECKVCGKRYIDERAIVSHYNEIHGKDGATVHNKFKCKLVNCDFETHSYRSFMYHRSKHETYPCTMCDKIFTKWKQLRSHMYGVHMKKKTTFPCKKCSKVYKQSCGLRIHMQSAHSTSDKSPYCAPCRMHFKTVHTLRQHLRMHSNHTTEADKKYMCDNCGARFLAKGTLKAHIEWVHLKRSNFKCPHCMKMVRTARSLKDHIAFVHEKQQLPRDKICDYCGKGFTMQRCLLAHIRTHTGERPYQCSQCSATFAHSASLYNHKKLVHNPHRERGRSRTVVENKTNKSF